MNNNTQNKDQDSKKILTLVVLIAVFMACTTSATYAYFAISASNDNTLKGTTATVGLTLTVTEQALGGTSSGTTQTGKMVPQLTNYIGTAIGANYKCIDANGNTVCKVYHIKIVNDSDAAVRVNGTIQFTIPTNGDTFQNLYWRKTTNATTVGTNTSVLVTNTSTNATLSSTTTVINYSKPSKIYDIPAANGTACAIATSSTGCTRVSLAANGGSAEYYIVVWIAETVGDANNNTTDEQNTTDKGTWNATIHFEGENGQGVTSTITA